MSFSHPFTHYKLPFSPYQISDVPITISKARHVICNTASPSKTLFTIVMNQSIPLPAQTRTLKDDIHIGHAKALKEVKEILVDKVRQNSVDALPMIDIIQRLGIEHHFEEEIEAAIQRQHLMLGTRSRDDLQLCDVALQFRLLRQEGFYVHADVFDTFKDKKGRLKEKYWGNIQGLTELLEASHLSIEGENGLDEVGDLSHHLLSSWFSRFDQDQHEARLIENTLKYPIHKSLSRFTPRNFLLPNSQLSKGWTRDLQKLSKIDTQIVNSMNLKEIFAVCKRWKDLGLVKELKFARNEPVKWYMWPMASLSDPCLSEERIELTKPLSLVIIDDIFDVYGRMDELTLFLDAVTRWDLAATEQLPYHMKACFKVLYDITNEFANKVQNKHGLNPIDTLIKSWVRLCKAFTEEAKWFESGHLPEAEEYLKNGIVSSGVQVALVHTFFLLGEGITKETVVLIDDIPSLVSSTATILRLCDDLEGDKDDNEAGNDGSYLNCYMKDHPEVSEEDTRKHIRQKISGAWKRLNKECLTATNPFPKSLAKVCLNAARMVPLMYSYDSYSPSRLEEHVKSLLYSDGIVQSILHI